MHKLPSLCAAALMTLATAAHADAGVDRMRAIQKAIAKGDMSLLSPNDQRAVQSGMQSATVASNPANFDPQTAQFTQGQAGKWDQLAREAFVAALPVRDQARGRSLLLGDGTVPGGEGQLYIFVSRSMPMSLLRTYALEAFYTGASLVVKGIRPGESVNDFIREALADFNSADGQILSGIEINPNLFDMFDVSMVPAVVWTNRIGLEDAGSGCTNLPEGTPVPKLTLDGPNETSVVVDQPKCAPLPVTSFYKITGSLALPYVLDRFEQAGAPKDAMDRYRQELAEMAENGAMPAGDGHGMGQIADDVRISRLPKYVLRYWKEALATMSVQRGTYGPAFGEGEDDAQYRAELGEQIKAGLGE